MKELNPKEKLFEEIRIQQPKWWNLLLEDKELYIEIRKDNSINVYFKGNSIARISYNSDFVAKTHQKFLGDPNPRKQDKKGKNIFEYDTIDLLNFNKNTISEMKKHMSNDGMINIKEKQPEQWIQGKMINENKNYIDSEFAFNKDIQIGKLRIDLIEISNGVLTFIELKEIFDSRLRKKVENPRIPKIIEQMEKYRQFINTYEVDIIEYYKKLIDIKHSLGLTTNKNTNFTINKTPKLIIADTYRKMTPDRVKRISDIKDLLANNNIDFEIIKCN